MMTKVGVIVKGIGGFYYVDTGESKVYECRAKGIFRKNSVKPLVGDRVVISVLSDTEGNVDEILPRKNALYRPAIANVDELFLVVSEKKPNADYFLIDKITACASLNEIKISLVINKIDIGNGREIERIYRCAGFDVFRVCALSKQGIDSLKEELALKLSVFSGVSGVGKSSILNALELGETVKTGDLSKKIARGQHTTRHSELFLLEDGGYIADTPGFGNFDLVLIEMMENNRLDSLFPDLFRYVKACEFTSCSHRKEKGCGVVAALNRGDIEPTRYASYQKLYEMFGDVKDWERKK